MTHIENIPHIIQHGITLTSSSNNNPAFLPIGDTSLISSRNLFLMPNGRTLGEYIPFYFGVRMPMLYVVQKGFNAVKAISAENIVYCVTSLEQIINHNLDFVFTNGHAVDGFSNFYYPADISNIENLLDQKAINSKYWKDDRDLDLKRRKEAEFLVASDIPTTAIRGYVVYNEAAKNKLFAFGIAENHIIIKSEYYF